MIFDAIKRGVDEGYDIVICDTAGRLHSNAGLMDELKKLRRVADKAMPGAPHETWMVLDATTGQNAISQAKTFKADMEISGIVLTKLDGSSKGGVVLGICDELKVPVRFVGVGEKIGDLRPFDPGAFVEALYSDASAGADAPRRNASPVATVMQICAVCLSAEKGTCYEASTNAGIRHRSRSCRSSRLGLALASCPAPHSRTQEGWR